MEKIEKNDLVMLYRAVVAKREYDRTRNESQARGFLSGLFSRSPKDPLPMFKDSGEALAAFNRALAVACPDLNGYIAGRDGPGHYKVSTDLKVDKNGFPLLHSRADDYGSGKFGEHFREYDPESGEMVPAYQHDSNPVANRANKILASTQECFFGYEELRGAHRDFLELCNSVLPACVKDAARLDRKAVEKLVEKADKEFADMENERDRVPCNDPRLLFTGGAGPGTDFQAYDEKVGWMNKINGMCRESASFNTKELRARYACLRSDIESVWKDRALFDDILRSGKPKDAGRLGEFHRLAADAFGNDRYNVTDKTAFLAFAAGYSKEDILKYLEKHGSGSDEWIVDEAHKRVLERIAVFRDVSMGRDGHIPLIEEYRKDIADFSAGLTASLKTIAQKRMNDMEEGLKDEIEFAEACRPMMDRLYSLVLREGLEKGHFTHESSHAFFRNEKEFDERMSAVRDSIEVAADEVEREYWKGVAEKLEPYRDCFRLIGMFKYQSITDDERRVFERRGLRSFVGMLDALVMSESDFEKARHQAYKDFLSAQMNGCGAKMPGTDVKLFGVPPYRVLSMYVLNSGVPVELCVKNGNNKVRTYSVCNKDGEGFILMHKDGRDIRYGIETGHAEFGERKALAERQGSEQKQEKTNTVKMHR